MFSTNVSYISRHDSSNNELPTIWWWLAHAWLPENCRLKNVIHKHLTAMGKLKLSDNVKSYNFIKWLVWLQYIEVHHLCFTELQRHVWVQPRPAEDPKAEDSPNARVWAARRVGAGRAKTQRASYCGSVRTSSRLCGLGQVHTSWASDCPSRPWTSPGFSALHGRLDTNHR